VNEQHIGKLAGELNLAQRQIRAAATLLDEGATIPFIARYRKEVTGSLDEVSITAIRDRLEQLAQLDDRRDAICKSLQDRDLLTDALKEQINAAQTMAVLEDLYLPFRPKRRTRATIAREKGLEPLSRRLFSQDGIDPVNLNLLGEASYFINVEKGVISSEEALAGARDIIAEWVSEDAPIRSAIRDLLLKKARFSSEVITGKEGEGVKYRDYYDWEEPVGTVPSHRMLAMRRGEREGFLILRLVAPDDEAIALLKGRFIKGDTPASGQVREALEDGYERLLFPSMETEVRMVTKERADEEAIRVFAENLRQLLLAPPLGEKNILAIDPGFRTGCKVVSLDRQGKLLYTGTIFPHKSEKERSEAGENVIDLCGRFHVEAIAVGNGTAGRETVVFLNGLGLPRQIQIISVNESGASVYSASEAARDEFPEQDVTVRGAVSIGRRLMDPLAELVKIDPKSIGVGQYQHDVDQPALKRSLDDIVMSCVNAVGVEVNTASKQLLAYVSGLGPALAKAIVAYRDEHGPFITRESLKKVPRLGPKAFEQAAGFLRIRGASNPLDASAVHPESYPIVKAMAADLGCSVWDLMTSEGFRNQIDLERYLSGKVGMPTLQDIMAELARPGRDPREQFETFAFAEGIEKIEDLKPGLKLPGIITNITAFGAFVDIGVHQDGLIHVSQLSNRFVKAVTEVVKVHQKVMVTVISVDVERKRIALSMKDTL
jgi:protein Tex